MNVLDKYLNPHAAALSLRNKRVEILGANIANAATPNFKARDIDFKAEYLRQTGGGGNLDTTSPLHMSFPAEGAGGSDAEVLFRTPISPSLDGNTVELHVEQLQFAENATRYEASLQFLNDRIRGLRTALRGE